MKHFTQSIALYLTVTCCSSRFFNKNELSLSVVSKQYVHVHMCISVFVITIVISMGESV